MTDGDLIIDEYGYFSLAEKKRDEGDLIGSLTILRNIEEAGTKNLEVFAMMGEIFFDMEIYSLSQEYWFRYLAGSNRVDVKLRAYSALGATFCMTMDNYLMGYYYDLEFALNPDAEQDYDHVLFDYLDFNKDEYPDFYVAYSAEGLSGKNLFVSAADAYEHGQINEAISRFSAVSPDCEEFDEAVYRAVCCMKDTGISDEEILAFLHEKYDEAKGKGKIAMYICEMLDKNDKQSILGYLDVALDSDLEDPSDNYLIARYFAEFGEHDKAMAALDKSLDINPYELRSIYLYGVILYNQGLYEKSRAYFKSGYDISRDQVNLFYYELTFDKGLMKKYPELPFSYRLPENQAADRITSIAVLIAGSKTKLKKQDPDRLIALADYALVFSNNLSSDMIKAFMVYGPNKVKKYFIYKLMSQGVRNYDKMAIIEALALTGFDKKIDVVFENIYLKIRLYKATFDSDPGDVFLNAYALAVSRMFAFCKDISSLRDTAYRIYFDLERAGKLKKVKNYHALAALIAKESGVRNINEETFEKYFGATEEDIGNIYKLLGDVIYEDY